MAMNKALRCFSLLAVFLPVFMATAAKDQCPVQKPDKCLTTEDIKAAINEFTIHFYQQLAGSKSTPANTNIVLLPLHASTALLMACAAAKGTTQSEIITALNLGTGITCQDAFAVIQYLYRVQPHRSDPPTEFDDITIAINRFYVDKTIKIKPDFLNMLEKSFNQTAGVVNFKGNAAAAVGEMNKWVSGQTDGNIKNVVTTKSVNSKTEISLLNSHYLQFIWLHQFDPKGTKPAEFTNIDGTKKTVPMMNMKLTVYYYLDNLNGKKIVDAPPFEVVEVRNHWGTASILFFLPKESKDLTKLEKALSASFVNKVFETLSKTKMNLTIPKFAIELATDVNQVSKGLGISTLFSKDADLSAMTDDKSTSINGIAHKAMIDVNERGLKAAAALEGGGRKEISFELPIGVILNRPFFFVIRTRRTLFLTYIGRVTNL